MVFEPQSSTGPVLILLVSPPRLAAHLLGSGLTWRSHCKVDSAAVFRVGCQLAVAVGGQPSSIRLSFFSCSRRRTDVNLEVN